MTIRIPNRGLLANPCTLEDGDKVFSSGFKMRMIPNLTKTPGKPFHILKTHGTIFYHQCDYGVLLFSNLWEKKKTTFKVCDSSLKAVTWQSGTENRAFIHLKRATPMMSVTDDCKTLPSLSPHSRFWSLRAEGKEGGGRGDNYQYK